MIGSSRSGPGAQARVMLVKDGLGIGGAELQLLLLARGLTTAKYQVRVVNLSTAGTLEAAFSAASAPVTRLPRSFRFDFGPVIRMARLIRETRPEVVQSFHWLANLYTTLAVELVPHACRPKNVTAVRGHYYLGPKGPFRAALDRVTARRVDLVVANCHALLRDVEAHGIRFKHAAVIYNGVRLDAERHASTDRGAVRFTSVGRLVAVKRPRDVLRAASNVCARYPGARFSFVGDGPERPALEQLTTELGLTRHVTFHGEVLDSAALLRQSDVLVLASAHEGLPNAILEGMAAALPIVATRVGGVPEVVEHGTNGLLVPPANPRALATALETLAADRSLRERMGGCSRELARTRFSEESMVTAYRAVYAGLTSGGPAHLGAGS